MADEDLRATPIKPGYFLVDNPPASTQFRARKARIKPVIVVHTAEGGTDLVGPDTKAEDVARFIQGRADAGSYHTLSDRDSITQLVPFAMAAFGDRTGSNEWAIHISCSINSADWPKLSAAQSWWYLYNLASAAVGASLWLIDQGFPPVQARPLTKAESDQADANGFIAHGKRDPDRRTDPGDRFEWQRFFNIYQILLDNELAARVPTPPTPPTILPPAPEPTPEPPVEPTPIGNDLDVDKLERIIQDILDRLTACELAINVLQEKTDGYGAAHGVLRNDVVDQAERTDALVESQAQVRRKLSSVGQLLVGLVEEVTDAG